MAHNFVPHSYHRGSWYWTCPDCGVLNRNRLGPHVFKVKCKNRECQRQWEHFDGLRPVCLARDGGLPRDRIMDLAPMRAMLLLPRRLSASAPLNVVLPAVDVETDVTP